jgi:pimeloyl-ACP methyl ester carboxylesterase
MGGNIAVTYALENPDRLAGLVLVGSSGAPIEAQGGGMLAYTISQTPSLNQLMRHITPRSMVAKSLSQSVSNQDVVTEEAIDRYWELARYPGTRDATRVRLSTSRPPYTEEQMAGLAVPTLLMWGVEDALVPLAAAQWYAEHLPNSQLVSYDNIGHLPMEEHATHSASDLQAWLGTLPAISLEEGGAEEPVG